MPGEKRAAIVRVGMHVVVVVVVCGGLWSGEGLALALALGVLVCELSCKTFSPCWDFSILGVNLGRNKLCGN